MLDEILTKAIREIATNCSFGCTPSELWTHLNNTTLSNNKKFKLTDTTKRYIHGLLINHQSISIKYNQSYVDEKPLTATTKTKKTTEEEDEEIENKTKVLAVYKKPKTTILDWKLSNEGDFDSSGSGIKLDKNDFTLVEQISDKFIYIADKYNQTLSMGLSYEQLPQITAIQWRILERVSQSRTIGSTARDLSNEFNIDSRNIFVPIKSLALSGIIVKEDIVGNVGGSVCVTIRLFLKKNFTPRQINLYREPWKPKYFIKAALLRYLELEPSHSMLMTDLSKKLNYVSITSFKKNKKWLLDNEFISQIDTKPARLNLEIPIGDHFWDLVENGGGKDDDDDEGGDGSKTPSSTTKNATTKTPTSTAGGEEEDGGEEDTISMNADSNLIMEQPINQQVFNIIKKAGKKGCTLKEIEQKAGILSIKWIAATIKSLIVSYKVKIIADNVGKQLTYRVYFDQSDLIKNPTSNNGQQEEEQLDPYLLVRNFEEPTKRYKGRLLNYEELVYQSKIYNTPNQLGSEVQQSQLTKTTDDNNKEEENYGDNQQQQKTLPPQQEPLKSIISTQPPPLSESEPQGGHRMIPETLSYLTRKESIYNRVVESRGCVLWTLISFQHQKGDTSIDNKSIKRIVDTLILEKKISLVTFYSQTLKGAHKKSYFVFDSKYNIDDEEIQQIIESIKDLPSNLSIRNISRGIKKNDDDSDEDTIRLPDGSKPSITASLSASKKTNSVSVGYGFVKGSIIRSKLLHQFFWSFACRSTNKTLRSANTPTSSTTTIANIQQSNENDLIPVNKELEEKSRIFLNLFLKYLPISDYLKIISQNTEIQGLYEYIQNNTLIIDLPIEIKKQLFTNISFNTKLSELVSILIKLGLISKSITKGYTEYTFNRNVDLIYYGNENGSGNSNGDGDGGGEGDDPLKPIIKKYDFSNFEILKLYWSDLQFLSLLPRDPSLPTPPPEFICNRLPILQNILMWGVPKVQLTDDIKSKLTRIFNERRSITKDEIKEIAFNFNVSSYKILTFYRKYNKDKKQQEKLKLKRMKKKLRKQKQQQRKQRNGEDYSEFDTDEDDDDDDGDSGSDGDDSDNNSSGDDDSGIEKRSHRSDRRTTPNYDDDYQVDKDEQEGEQDLSNRQRKRWFGKKKIRSLKNGRTKTSQAFLNSKVMSERRKLIKQQLLPYHHFKWTPFEDSQLLKHYTEVFREFFLSAPEGVKNSNNIHFITPSGIPSMLNPQWDTLGAIVSKLGQLCYRRMRLLVKKYPSYKNFVKSNSTPDLPLTIKEFNTFFNYKFSKNTDIEEFEQSKFDSLSDSITRDKIFFLITIPENEYSYQLSTKVINVHKRETSRIINALNSDKIIKNSKSRNSERTTSFCVQKINYKNTSLTKDFLHENRVFISSIKEFPISKQQQQQQQDQKDGSELFQYDPLTSGGSVSSMMYLLNILKVVPVITVKPSFDIKNEKPPKPRDFSGGQRLDLILTKFDVSYQVQEYIDYAYIENERKRAINPDVIIGSNDPLESDKIKFQKMFSNDDDNGDNGDNGDDDNNNNTISSSRKKIKTKTAATTTTTTDDTNLEINKFIEISNLLKNEYYYKFEFQEFKELFDQKIQKMVNISVKSGRYIALLVLAIQEVYRVIYSKVLEGAKRSDIIDHFIINGNANEIIKQLIDHDDYSRNHFILENTNSVGSNGDDYQDDGEEAATATTTTTTFTIDYSQYIYQNLLSFILELKSLGIIDTHFTFHYKVYIAKQYFKDSLLPLDYTLQQQQQQQQYYNNVNNNRQDEEIETTVISKQSSQYTSNLNYNNNNNNSITSIINGYNEFLIDYKLKKLIKPWIDINGKINRTLFNKMFFEFLSAVYLCPGSTLEKISHKLQRYSPSLLREVAIILQSTDYIDIFEFEYTPPSLFTNSQFIKKPFNQNSEGCTNLIFNSKPKFFNTQSDFSVYLLTEDF